MEQNLVAPFNETNNQLSQEIIDRRILFDESLEVELFMDDEFREVELFQSRVALSDSHVVGFDETCLFRVGQ